MQLTTHPIRRLLVLLSCLLLGAVFLTGCGSVPVERRGQTAFDSPRDAAVTFVEMLRAGKTQELRKLFGPKGHDIFESGDPIADARNRQVFVIAFDQRWRLDEVDPTTRELVIGDEEWPFPVPLVKDADGWRFDTEAGLDEMLARRVGRNELAAVATCRVYVTAQREYAKSPRDGSPAGAYAQRVRSRPGKHDGLYWATTASDPRPSPLSSLAAEADAEGYGAEPTKPRPFRGYFFRILTRQGKDAPGGARDYVADGRMTGGFALLAYPAEYGNSGVMTFIVNQDGVVYEKDLGPETVKSAEQIREYNPDASWAVTE